MTNDLIPRGSPWARTFKVLAGWPQSLSGWGIWWQVGRRCPGLGAAAYLSAVLMGVCKMCVQARGAAGRWVWSQERTHQCTCLQVHVHTCGPKSTFVQGHFLSLISTPHSWTSRPLLSPAQHAFMGHLLCAKLERPPERRGWGGQLATEGAGMKECSHVSLACSPLGTGPESQVPRLLMGPLRSRGQSGAPVEILGADGAGPVRNPAAREAWHWEGSHGILSP